MHKKLSTLKKRQQDAVSCGPITFDDILHRMNDDDLDDSQLIEDGAAALRAAQLSLVNDGLKAASIRAINFTKQVQVVSVNDTKALQQLLKGLIQRCTTDSTIIQPELNDLLVAINADSTQSTSILCDTSAQYISPNQVQPGPITLQTHAIKEQYFCAGLFAHKVFNANDRSFSNLDLIGVNFAHATFSNFSFVNAQLVFCNFSDVVFNDTIDLSGVKIYRQDPITYPTFMAAVNNAKQHGIQLSGDPTIVPGMPPQAAATDKISGWINTLNTSSTNTKTTSIAEQIQAIEDEIELLKLTNKGQDISASMTSATQKLIAEQTKKTIEALTAQQEKLTQDYDKRMAWQEKRDFFFNHPNPKQRTYYRAALMHIGSIFQALFVLQSELIKINDKNVLRGRQLANGKKVTTGVNNSTHIATTALEAIHISFETLTQALQTLSNLGASALNVVAGPMHHFLESIPVVGSLFKLLTGVSEYARESMAENTIEHVGEQLAGFTPSDLEIFSIELACALTSRYAEQINILKDSDKGLVRFAQCAAVRILVGLMTNALHTEEKKKNVLGTFLDFILTNEIYQWRFLYTLPVLHLRIDIQFPFSHETLEVDDHHTRYAQANNLETKDDKITEDKLYRLAGVRHIHHGQEQYYSNDDEKHNKTHAKLCGYMHWDSAPNNMQQDQQRRKPTNEQLQGITSSNGNAPAISTTAPQASSNHFKTKNEQQKDQSPDLQSRMALLERILQETASGHKRIGDSSKPGSQSKFFFDQITKYYRPSSTQKTSSPPPDINPNSGAPPN